MRVKESARGGCYRKNWTSWAGREQSWRDARKIRIAQRLRAETSVTLKWIATELNVRTWTHVANCLQNVKDKSESKNQHELILV